MDVGRKKFTMTYLDINIFKFSIQFYKFYNTVSKILSGLIKTSDMDCGCSIKRKEPLSANYRAPGLPFHPRHGNA